MYQNFHEYQRFKGEMPGRKVGVMVSMTGGGAWRTRCGVCRKG